MSILVIRMHAVPPTLITFMLALAGCFGANAPGEDSPPPAEASLAFLDVPAHLDGCVEVAATFYTASERVQRLLPPGFMATQGRLFGGVASAPTGQASVTAAALSCASAELEGGPLEHFVVAVDVEAPETEAVETRDTHHAYLLGTFTAGPHHRALLETANASVTHTDVSVSVQDTPISSVGSALVSDADGMLFKMEAAGAGRMAGGVAARFWEVIPDGLLVLDWKQDDEPLVAYDLGAVHSCEIREGTILHDLLGRTDCTDPQTTGVVVSMWRTEGRLRVVPGGSVEMAEE